MTQCRSKYPSTLVKSVGCRQRDTKDAHDQVNKRQIADEEICGAMSFLVVRDEEEQEEVAGAGDQDHSRVERDEEELQVEQEVQARKGRS